MPNSIRIDKNVPVEMRDGVVTRANVYRPDDNGKHPAILIRTPYNKELASAIEFLNPVDAAFAGYAVVVQDVRGRFASDGYYRERDRVVVEGPDGYDSVENIANQPWCDGNVGMGGASYGAGLAWSAAVENPPHLKAIAPWIGGAGIIDQILLSGTTLLWLRAYWVPMMAFDIADKLEKQGKDMSEMRQVLMHALRNPEVIFNFLPLKDVPRHFKFEDVPEIREPWQDMVLNPLRAAYEAGTGILPHDRVMVPCLHVSGWYDLFTWGTFKNSESMREKGGSELAREGQHIIMGPWAHESQLPGILGAVNFGGEASGLGALVSQQHIAFFNKYLLGMDVEVPATRYFVMGLNRWRNADTWPLSETRWQRFFLHSKGHANTAGGDGLLSPDESGSEAVDTYTYDPLNPVPVVGGRVPPQLPGAVAGPMDQCHIEARNDVLCYTTPELKEDVEVTGPLELHLLAATSTRDTDFTAKLVDVYPDGRSYNVVEGIIRARYRKSVFEPELVNPGEVNEYTVNMGQVSQLFRKGHRMRIDISSSNFPAADRNMNTGNAIGEDAEGIPATQTIYHQQGYTSYIDLPVITGK